MVQFSLGVIGKKVSVVLKIQVFLGSVSRYFLSGFAILLGLLLKPLGLCVEFNSASNSAIFDRGHGTKSTTCTQNTGFPWEFSRYLLFRFAIILGLFLKPLRLCAEFNSASNGPIFTRGHCAKSVTCAQNTGFPWEVFKVFPVQIRYAT